MDEVSFVLKGLDKAKRLQNPAYILKATYLMENWFLYSTTEGWMRWKAKELKVFFGVHHQRLWQHPLIRNFEGEAEIELPSTKIFSEGNEKIL